MTRTKMISADTIMIEPVNSTNPMLACERCEVVMSLEDKEFLIICRFKSLQEYVKYLNSLFLDPYTSTPYPWVYVFHVFLDREEKTIYTVLYGKFVRSVAMTTGLKEPLEIDPLYMNLMLLYIRLKKMGLPVKEPRGVNVKEMYEAYLRGRIAEYYAKILGVPEHVVRGLTIDLLVDTVESPDPLFFEFIRKVGYILGIKEFIEYAEKKNYETAKVFEDAKTKMYVKEVEGYDEVVKEMSKALDMYREQVESILNRYRERAGAEKGKPPTII